MRSTESLREPIAITGMALRLPGGVTTPDRFWKALAEGEDLIGTVPADRWDAESLRGSSPDEAGTLYDVHGGFLEDVSAFDANFFGISAREASRADPQQRLLLELAWEALERSSINPQSLARSQTGIWLGISNEDWSRILSGDPRRIDGYTGTGAARSMAAGRIAHFLGTYGPAEVIDTACSSSLVAVHHAVQSLRGGETNLALVGGVNLILSPELHLCFSRAGMLSRSGRCRTFDNAADGYVRSEACCVIVLKRLSDARRDGDPILAVIRGTAVNQDGRSARLTAPNVRAQQAVMKAALADAQLQAGAVSYVEVHGTGTPLGDPMEVLSIGSVYGHARTGENPLWIGSVKTNLGHTEGAAGLAGLLKTVLMMQPGRGIAPHLHCSSPNSRISWERWPIEIPKVLTPWPHEAGARFAGVSSFGFSGTNAHVIVESFDAAAELPTEWGDDSSSEALLCLSAADPQALRALSSLYAGFLRQSRESFRDICRSVLMSRAQLPCRLTVKAASGVAAADSLELWLEGGPAPGLRVEPVPASAANVEDSLEEMAGDFLAGEKVSTGDAAGKRAALPLYPFQRKPFWYGELPQVRFRQEREQVWLAACAEADRQSRQGPLGWRLENYRERWAALGRLTLAYARNALIGAGAFPNGEPATADEVMGRCGFQEIYRRLVTRWLRNLAADGLLLSEDQGYRPTDRWAPAELGEVWRTAEQALAGDPEMLAYFRRCGDGLGDIVAGRANALETLFPGGSFAFAERLYAESSEARYCNAIVAEAVRTMVRGWSGRRLVRILEVGAGTGGTTSGLAPLLPAEETEYWFTDLSELFLRRARQKFEHHPFVRFALFDLDREPEEQHVPIGRFDVIVAANALHASRDLRASLRRMHRLLAQGGALVLIETTVHQVCFDMSIGLIDGWQHFEDEERREHPLLDPDQWSRVFAETGFQQTLAVPAKDSPAFVLGQQVLLAQRDFESTGKAAGITADRDDTDRRSSEQCHRIEPGAGAAELRSLPDAERARLISGIVRTTICRVCQLDVLPETLNDRDRLSDLGMDSLIALELRSELGKALELEGRISSTVAFDTGTVGELARLLVELLGPEGGHALPDGKRNAVNPAAAAMVSVETLQEMSDAEVEALLQERLTR